jgi:hypothetical protein
MRIQLRKVGLVKLTRSPFLDWSVLPETSWMLALTGSLECLRGISAESFSGMPQVSLPQVSALSRGDPPPLADVPKLWLGPTVERGFWFAIRASGVFCAIAARLFNCATQRWQPFCYSLRPVAGPIMITFRCIRDKGFSASDFLSKAHARRVAGRMRIWMTSGRLSFPRGRGAGRRFAC